MAQIRLSATNGPRGIEVARASLPDVILRECFEGGIFRYLTKPIKIQESIDVLDMALTSSEIGLNDPWRREATTSR